MNNIEKQTEKTNNRIGKGTKFKNVVDVITKNTLLTATIIGSLIIVLILAMIIGTGIKPFLPDYPNQVNLIEFLVGTNWFPAKQEFSVGFIIINTLYVTLLAVVLVVPVSVLTALYISKIANKKIAGILRTIVEILASIPSIIYGLFGAAFIVNFIQIIYPASKGGLSTLAVVLVLSMMIFPTITSIAETSIRAVPSDIEQASLALGATKTQTNFKVVLTSAKSGIFAGIILGVGRALGEATAVTLVAGNFRTGPSFNPFLPTRTLTSTMLTGIHESQGLPYDIRFSVALVLMILILVINAVLNLVKQKVGNING